MHQRPTGGRHVCRPYRDRTFIICRGGIYPALVFLADVGFIEGNNHSGLRSYIKERCDLQESITQKTFEIGVKLGIITDITWQDVLDNTPVGTWICIDSVINTFRNKKITPKEGFGPIRSKVFNSPEARALKMPYPTAERVIKTVRKAGGVIALAHSGYYTFPYLERLMEFGLNGIETGHPNIKPSILPELVAAAEKYNLYQCGGTDHYGPMSCCGGEHAYPTIEGIDEEQYICLKERKFG